MQNQGVSRPATAGQGRSQISNVQMEQVKGTIKTHLEKHKFFEGLKSAVAKDPKLNKLDRNQIIEKLKSEGVLNDILQQIPTKRKPMNQAAGGATNITQSISQSDSQPGNRLPQVAPSQRRMMNAQDLDPNKRYMSCTVLRGNAFVDFVNVRPDEQMSVTVSFLKNRFSTQIVPCSSDPIFDETFMFEFVGDNEEVKFDPAMLLKLNQPIHITILKHRTNEKPVVLGTKNIDWRPSLFCNQIEINAEILPISLTHQGSLGILTMHIDLVPSLSRQELLTEEVVERQTGLEKKFESETIQRFLDYAHDWWNDYKQIRQAHKTRLVKIFAETDDRESSVYKPVCSLISPMMADRLLESPLHAARFVSLIPFHRMEAPGAEKVEVWHSMQSFLSRGCGDSEDHAVLLCNLLLGFGLDAYVVVGTNSEGSHAWVMTRQPPNAQGKQHVDFWESLTGTKLASDDPRVHRFYRTVGCVFSNRTFFANIQADDRVVNTEWDMEDQYLWKAMSPQHINSLTPNSSIGYLMPSNMFTAADEEKLLESILKQKVGSLRRNEHNLNTNWDAQLSYLLSTALANYEFERIGGGNFATTEFQHGIKNYVPEGHTFKAFPIQFTHCDSDRIITHIYGNPVGKEIITARGDQCRLAIRVKIVQYPENISAVWVMLAVRTRGAREN